MNEPTGPLPPGVYWRRRALAIGGTALAALLFIWAIGALLGGDDSQGVQGAANDRGVPPLPTASRPPSSSPPPLSSSARASASATTSPAPTSPAVPAASTTTTTPAPPPGPPPVCPDTAIRLAAVPGQPTYRVGQRPAFTLQVTNVSTVTCTRDLSHQFRALSVVALSAPGVPLWTSSDCYAETTHEIRALAPGQTVSYGVVWAGRTSAPGCPAQRSTVPAGQYGVVARLGPLSSAPTPFTLTP